MVVGVARCSCGDVPRNVKRDGGTRKLAVAVVVEPLPQMLQGFPFPSLNNPRRSTACSAGATASTAGPALARTRTKAHRGMERCVHPHHSSPTRHF
jgi:hypothetical protein